MVLASVPPYPKIGPASTLASRTRPMPQSPHGPAAHPIPVRSPVPPQRSAANGASRQVTTCAKKCRVAINGFGRIGRQFLRCWEGRDSSNLEIV